MIKSNKTKTYRTIFSIISLVTVLPFIIALIVILFHISGSKLHKSDVAVVFGAAIRGKGKPSYTLLVRTWRAAKLYKNKLVNYIIVSGTKEETIEMERILLDKNIPKNRIIRDEYGHNTKKTVENTKKIIDKNNWKHVIMVSSSYHLARIHLFCHRNNIKYYGTPAKSKFFLKISYFFIREVFAILYYLIFH